MSVPPVRMLSIAVAFAIAMFSGCVTDPVPEPISESTEASLAARPGTTLDVSLEVTALADDAALEPTGGPVPASTCESFFRNGTAPSCSSTATLRSFARSHCQSLGAPWFAQDFSYSVECGTGRFWKVSFRCCRNDIG